MTDAEIYSQLTEIFHEAFDDNNLVLKPELAAKDVSGWDSIKMVAIIISVESKFQIRLRSRDVDRLANVGDLVAIIRKAKSA